MLAPARSGLLPGAARLGVDLVAGSSTVTTCAAHSPARLLTPIHRGRAAWCYLTSFGGGLVAGDHLDVHAAIGAGATAYLSTQASTKVYRSDDAVAQADLTATVASDAVLVNLPAHVTCFRGASFHAVNHYQLEPGASLIALDWYSAGRSAYDVDEEWAFRAFATRSRVRIGDQVMVDDAVELVNQSGLPSVQTRMANLRAWATVIVCGPRVAAVSEALLAGVAAPLSDGMVRESVSPVGDGCLWRLAGPAVEPVQQLLRQRLAGVSALIGDDPWKRTW